VGALAAALAGSASGCATGRAGGRAATGARLAEGAAELVRQSGDRAALTVLIDPRRVSELQALPLTLLSRSDASLVSALRAAPDVWSALWWILVRPFQPGEAPRWPATLAGWDDSRPIVVARFDAPTVPLGTLGRILIDRKQPAPLDMYARHRVIVPARDEAALRSAVQAALRAAGFAAQPSGVYAAGALRLMVQAGRGHVRIEALALPADAPPPSEAAIQAALAAPVQVPASLPTTPALRFASGTPALARAYVRPWRLRDLNCAAGSAHIRAALAVADADMAQRLALTGWAELAAGDDLLGAGGGEAADAALALTASADAVRVTSVLSLTAAGQAAYQAAAQQAYHAQALPGPVPPLRLSLAVDAAALLQQAPALPAVVAAASPREARRALFDRVRECGSACMVYLGLRHPLALARLLGDEVPEVRDYLPRGFDLSLLDVTQLPPRGALVGVLADSPRLRGLLANVLSMPLVKMLLMHSEVPLPGGLLALRAGYGLDPATVYAADLAGPAALAGAATLAEADVDLQRISSLWQEAQGLLRAIQPLGRWHAQIQLSRPGTALIMQSALTPAGPEAPAPLAAPVESEHDDGAWRAALAAVEPSGPGESAGASCLRQATEQTARVLRAMQAVDPSMQATLLRHADAELAPSLRCAAADPATRSAAAELRELLTRVTAAPPAP
jgi:hypothetical protein